MSKDTDPQSEAQAVTITVQKSDIESLLSSRTEAGLDDEFLWPIEPRSLALLYRASAEHGRAIQVKAESAFGGGLIGEADRIEELCETGAAEMFTLLGLDLETYANAFLQKIRSSDGERIIGLRRLPAITMCRFRAGFMQRVGLPNGQTRKITFTADEIIQLREPCPMGLRYALPTWVGAEGMLELAYAATRYNASFFKNNAIPEYAITFKGVTPTAEQKDAIREFFRNDFQGMDNAHRTLILTSGDEGEVEINRLTSEVKDGDFLKLIDAARDRIPVAHGVPPRMLGIMTAGQLGGGGEVSGQLFTFEHLTLRPKRRRMLDQIRPILRELGIKPGDPDKPVRAGEVLFRPLDLTPPKDDTEDLPGLVSAGILTPEEAQTLLPAYAKVQDRPATQGDGEGSQTPVERSAPDDTLDVLAALLTRM